MENYVSIENDFIRFYKELELETTLKKELKKELFSDIVLYQSHPYKIKFFTKDNDIENVSLNIGGENFEIEDNYEEDGYYVFEFENERYFNCIWGYTQIIIEIRYKDIQNVLYSKLLNIELDSNHNKGKEINNSVENMVKYVLDNNQELLKNPVRNKFSIINSNLENNELRNLLTEVELLRSIIECYQNNFEYFTRDIKYKIINIHKVDNFNKVKKLDLKTIKHIIKNPQELKIVDYNTGIRYMNQNLEPRNTIVSHNENIYNIYENKVILGFIKMIIVYLEERIKKKEKYIDLYKKNNSFYKLLFSYYEFYFDEITKLVQILKIIYHKYKNTLKCDDFYLDKMPYLTNIFTNIYHYRQCFIVIEKWFSKGNYNFENNKVITSFVSIDQLYEYYSLLNIINEVKNLGFNLENIKSFIYEDVNYCFNYTNTYYFRKSESIYITLYYQPIIYSYKYDNEITLYRVDGNKNYYSPDFLIKLKLEDGNKYIILDSKWQTRKTIERYSFQNIMKKYIMSIEGSEDDRIEFVGILQGRDDTKDSYIHQNGKIAKEKSKFNMPKFGIINFTPKNNDFYIIKNIIKGFIN